MQSAKIMRLENLALYGISAMIKSEVIVLRVLPYSAKFSRRIIFAVGIEPQKLCSSKF